MKLFKNGNISTMDKDLKQADSMIINENKFVYVGTEEGAKKYLEDKQQYETIDLKGATVIPGLNDSHMHLLHYGKTLKNLSFFGTNSIKELKERIKAEVEKREPGDLSWIEGQGWNQDYFQDEQRFPNKFDLDEVTGDIPALVIRACVHIGTLNTAALKIMGFDKESVKQYGDYVEVDENGEPTGVIKENLLELVKTHLSSIDMEGLKERIINGQEKLLEKGITSVQTDDFGYVPDQDYNIFFRALKELDEEGKLSVRIGQQSLFLEISRLKEFLDDGYSYDFGNEKYKITCIKLLSDGSLGARTAALRKPYADEPTNKGIAILSKDELNKMVKIAHDNNFSTAVHAIGDLAIEMSLDAIESAEKANPKGLRHGIVHCQITDEGLINRMRDLNVVALIQPIFVDYDMNIVADRVGHELAQTSYAWKTMKDKGIHIPFGTDCPVESFNPMPNIYSAVARRGITKNKDKVYLPNEKLTMEEAVYSYTMEGAYASGEEHIKGSISVNKLADFIVLDRDIFNLPSEEEILDVKVMKTYFDGNLVFDALENK